MKPKIILFLLVIFSLIFTGCKEEYPGSLYEDGSIPSPVENVQVKNIPGGARLKYTLPESENILYVKAVYEYPEGNIRDVISSTYTDTLLINGIGDTKEIEIELYCVNRSEQESEPVKVKINPLSPPVELIRESFVMQETFGGVIVSFTNPTKADMVLTIMINNDNEWQPLETLYTNKDQGVFAARGQDSVLAEFGVFAKDRWNNRSDTLKMNLKPIYETLIPSPTPVTTLHNDYNKHYQTYTYLYLFDGIHGDPAATNYAGTLLNSPASKLPQSFTFDFGKPTEISRFKYWMRTNGYFNFGAPEIWEIWGTNELDADWSKWTFISDFKAVKPSGLPVGTLSAEDRATAEAGLDFEFPVGVPKYRYLRWKSTKNFGSVDYIQFSELTFWGSQN